MSKAPYVNPMQQAMLDAFMKSPAAPAAKRLAKSFDRVKLRPMREDVKVSFRTAQKLRAEGVLE